MRIAVIGCGHWGPNHIRNFSSLPGCRVAWAVDRDPQRLERIAERFPDLPTTREAAEALADPAVDAVVVAVPTAGHYPLTRDALQAGKHVLCEKPLCLTGPEGEELVALARRQERVLMVGHVFLFNPGILKVWELIRAGELGEVRYLSAVRTNLGPIRSDVNAAYDLATHDISIFNALLDAVPEQVSATGGTFLQPGVEDVVFATLRYPGGTLANIHAGWLNPKKVRQMTVVGSRRMATWDDLELGQPVTVYDKGAETSPEYADYGEFLRVSLWEGEVSRPKVPLEEPLKAQSLAFLEAIKTGEAPRSDGAFSLGVVRTLEALDASLKAGGAPVAPVDSAVEPSS
jgi:predicted dehydrogenase